MPEVDISTLANNIRTRTISESHQKYAPSEQVAVEIKNGLGAPSGWADMGVLVGSKEEVTKLEELTEAWINETEGAKEMLIRQGFGKEEREKLFNKIREKIIERNRGNT